MLRARDDKCVRKQMPNKYSTGDAHAHSNGPLLQSYSATAALLDRPPTLGGGGALQFYGASPTPSPHVGLSHSSPPQQPQAAYTRNASPLRGMEQHMTRTMVGVGMVTSPMIAVHGGAGAIPLAARGSPAVVMANGDPGAAQAPVTVPGGAANYVLAGKWENEDKEIQRLAFKVNKEYTSFLEEEIKKLTEQVSSGFAHTDSPSLASYSRSGVIMKLLWQS